MRNSLRNARALLETDDAPRFSGGEPALMRDPKRGFRHAGEFFQAVRAGSAAGSTDERLRIIAAAPSTFGNESTGVDGGFAIPPDFAGEVNDLLMEQSLLPACSIFRTTSNSAWFPTDTTTPWGTNGVVASWQNTEGAALSQVKPVLTGYEMRLKRLLAYVPVTEELWQDAAFLGDYLTLAAGEACSWKASEAIVKGSGAGQPHGFLNAGSLLVQAKDGAQATNTISATNISGMLGKFLPGSLARAVWLIDSTAIPALAGLGATNYPMTWASGDDFVPGTKIPSLGRLAGRPVIVSQHMAAFSAQGDLALVDLASYQVLLRADSNNGLQVDFSMDVYFDAFAGAFRFRFRVDGQSKYAAPITTAKGGQASPFVALGAR